jgi:hypothetical protein
LRRLLSLESHTLLEQEKGLSMKLRSLLSSLFGRLGIVKDYFDGFQRSARVLGIQHWVIICNCCCSFLTRRVHFFVHLLFDVFVLCSNLVQIGCYSLESFEDIGDHSIRCGVRLYRTALRLFLLLTIHQGMCLIHLVWHVVIGTLMAFALVWLQELCFTLAMIYTCSLVLLKCLGIAVEVLLHLLKLHQLWLNRIVSCQSF